EPPTAAARAGGPAPAPFATGTTPSPSRQRTAALPSMERRSVTTSMSPADPTPVTRSAETRAVGRDARMTSSELGAGDVPERVHGVDRAREQRPHVGPVERARAVGQDGLERRIRVRDQR